MQLSSLLPAAAPPVEFSDDTLPWVDRPDYAAIGAGRVAAGTLSPELFALYRTWHELGYVILPRCVAPELIDAVVRDYERLWRERPMCRIQVGGAHGLFIHNLPDRASIEGGYRILDFHNLSVAARKLILNRSIVQFMAQMFDETAVAMQSLLFEYGSQQEAHQDFIYVPSGVPSHLAAAWIALEDIGPDQGPLSFFPGSHRIAKFDFGEGALTAHGHSDRMGEYREHIRRELQRLGCREEFFMARKGDVLLWHGALLHGGSPIRDGSRTRLSLVAHYSDVTAFPRDYRAPELPSQRIYEGEGVCYRWSHPGHVEGRYGLGWHGLLEPGDETPH